MFLLGTGVSIVHGQDGYWQQRANYNIEVELDDKKHSLEGEEKIEYFNNSPDTLNKMYFHLYFNAFQPGSMMDIKSLHVADPDRRVGSRISKLKKDEEGYCHVTRLKVNGKSQNSMIVEGTILEVTLSEPLLPGSNNVIQLEFESQIPIQIRRSGRNNAEGIDYSMSQWYPKLAEYDYMGWHPEPYVAREFYGVWGDFVVEIELPSKYVVAATGTLANADDIGYGYADKEPSRRPKELKWKFKAQNVHDFVWAADPDYEHTKIKADDGTVLHFFYQGGEKTAAWKDLPPIMAEALNWMNKRYGKYQYPSYSFIQGGDGGMEYPMATLITGNRPLRSLVGVAVHEWMHSWYQMMLGTNESLYGWMDEGFTSFGETETIHYLMSKGKLPGTVPEHPFKETLEAFNDFLKSGLEEPLTTHADHFITNAAYSRASYTKGEICLVQLEYIVGKEVFSKSLLRYFDEWHFKHPTPNDFFRIFEKQSGMELDWFQQYWVNTTHTIDYAVDTLINDVVYLSNRHYFPMPLDVVVTTKDGKEHLYYIPQSVMRGEKKPDIKYDSYTIAKDWNWTNPTYELKIKEKASDVESISIDPSYRLMDTDRTNNVYTHKKIE